MQHVMFGPDWEAACPGCTAGLDEMSPGVFRHMRSRDTAFAAVSRAPFAKLAAARDAKGWDFAWYSSFGNDFNRDYEVTVDDESGEPTEVGLWSYGPGGLTQLGNTIMMQPIPDGSTDSGLTPDHAEWRTLV